MGTMAGWTTRKANEATERARRDTAMKIAGAAEECARIREELLAELPAARYVFWYTTGTWLLTEVAVAAALDRVCPAQETTSPSTTSST